MTEPTPIRAPNALLKGAMSDQSKRVLKDITDSVADQCDIFKASIIGQMNLVATEAYFRGRADERKEWERGND